MGRDRYVASPELSHRGTRHSSGRRGAPTDVIGAVSPSVINISNRPLTINEAMEELDIQLESRSVSELQRLHALFELGQEYSERRKEYEQHPERLEIYIENTVRIIYSEKSR